METEPTLKDVLQAVHALGARIDDVEVSLVTRIGGVESSLGARIDGVETSLGAKIDAVDERVEGLATHVDERFAESEHRMMDFMDRRVGQSEARLEVKIGKLVGVLEKKQILTSSEASDVIRT